MAVNVNARLVALKNELADAADKSLVVSKTSGVVTRDLETVALATRVFYKGVSNTK